MTAAEVLKLIDAGFTADEIRAMEGQEDGTGAADPDAGADDKTGAEEDQQPAGTDPTADRVDRIEKLIEKMAGAIIKGTEGGDPNDPSERDNGLKSLLEGM